MASQSSEQLVHDRINLNRLVRRLEKAIADEDWNEDSQLPPRATWIKTRTTLQKLKHARKLLHNVEIHEHDPFAAQRYEDLRHTLDRLETVVLEVDKRAAPQPKRPAPILPTLPIPSPPKSAQPDPLRPQRSEEATEAELASPAETTHIAAQDLLLSATDTEPALRIAPINPGATLLPPNRPSSPGTSKLAGTPAFLQNSAALQEELSAQLAQMATQLKRNAVHFAGTLEKDKALLIETQDKLERNHDVMKAERLRVRDHRSKSWGTTWIVMLSIIVAAVGFVLTFMVIRIT